NKFETGGDISEPAGQRRLRTSQSRRDRNQRGGGIILARKGKQKTDVRARLRNNGNASETSATVSKGRLLVKAWPGVHSGGTGRIPRYSGKLLGQLLLVFRSLGGILAMFRYSTYGARVSPTTLGHRTTGMRG
ncbi:unnamed protein product, partial [Ectocarpus sp. 12 AP-2014]